MGVRCGTCYKKSQDKFKAYFEKKKSSTRPSQLQNDDDNISKTPLVNSPFTYGLFGLM